MKTIIIPFIVTANLLSCTNSSTTQNLNTTIQVKEVNVTELSKLAKVGNTILLDVRTPEEFEAGFISNATHINFYDSDFKTRINKLNKSYTYIVYCKSGYRSGKALQIMTDLGFKKVYNLTGGYDAWKNNL